MARTDPRPHYGSGRRLRKDGYVDVWEPEHPLARGDGYLFEHRKVAWDAKRLTDPTLEVHHKNHVRHDNRLVNLEVKDGPSHALDHAEERGWVKNQYGSWAVRPSDQRQSTPRPERTCLHCGANFSHERRRDAVYCSSRCQVTAWKRRARQQESDVQQHSPSGSAPEAEPGSR